MTFDAVVLAGGRGSRLGGVSKASLTIGDSSLLELVVHACSGARSIVVVGDVAAAPGYSVTREDPPFSGPVAAIDAGLKALAVDPSEHVLVLACDMPGAAAAVHELLAAADSSADGVIAIDPAGREQYLAAVYRTAALTHQLSRMTVADASVRQLTRGLTLSRVLTPAGATDDVDTWNDAAALGVTMRETAV